MADKQLMVRVSTELFKRIYVVQQKLEKDNPGIKPSMAETVRLLIERGLGSNGGKK